LIDILFSQLTDVFRIGLIVALVFTMQRTAAVTGRVVPLACGVLFVAVMLPTTLPSGSKDLMTAIGVGLVANTAILFVVLAALNLVARLRR
jgi:hypothetical protein